LTPGDEDGFPRLFPPTLEEDTYIPGKEIGQTAVFTLISPLINGISDRPAKKAEFLRPRILRNEESIQYITREKGGGQPSYIVFFGSLLSAR